jgi:hypothetical protein
MLHPTAAEGVVNLMLLWLAGQVGFRDVVGPTLFPKAIGESPQIQRCLLEIPFDTVWTGRLKHLAMTSLGPSLVLVGVTRCTRLRACVGGFPTRRQKEETREPGDRECPNGPNGTHQIVPSRNRGEDVFLQFIEYRAKRWRDVQEILAAQ